MRLPYQVLALPYRFVDGQLQLCVFHRSNCEMWQFISGGGEDGETPPEAARREIWEESGLQVEELLALKSMCYIGTDIYPQCYRRNWPVDTYVIPEYAFAFACKGEITLSHEHSHYAWMTLEEARQKLTWDSNKTAAYELYRRLGGE